jgi:hypothetical protein
VRSGFVQQLLSETIASEKSLNVICSLRAGKGRENEKISYIATIGFIYFSMRNDGNG